MDEIGEVLDEVKTLDEKLGGIGNTVEEFRKTLDQQAAEVAKAGEASADTKAKLDKLNEVLDEGEDLNQRLIVAKKAAEQVEELKAQVEAVQVAMTRAGQGLGGDGRDERAETKRIYLEALRIGDSALAEADAKVYGDLQVSLKALSVGTDTEGGYLAPPEYIAEIIKGQIEFSPVRAVARVRTTSRTSIQIPKRTGTVTAYWVAELGQRTESQQDYGIEEIPTHELHALVPVSQQILEDAAVNMEAELNQEFSEQFGVAEGAAFVTGDSAGKPEGFMFNTAIASVNSGSASTIADANGQADGIIDLYHKVKTAYAVRGTFMLNRQTLGSVRKLKDQQGMYIWQPGLADLRPNTILSAPYVEATDMPNEGANTFPIAFGDFNRGYTIVDRIQMSVLRDPYSAKKQGMVEYLARKRVGGQVVLAEAIAKLKCAVNS